MLACYQLGYGSSSKRKRNRVLSLASLRSFEQRMTDDIIQSQDKRLSEHSRILLRELEKMAVSASRIIPELYANLKDDGFDPWECRRIIEGAIDISQKSIRRLLPTEAKQFQHPSPRTILVSKVDKMSTLTSDIAQPKQVIEVRPEPEREPEAPTTSNKLLEVTLSKAFETELRMFLINRQQQALRLEIDLETMEVIRIVD